MRNAFATGIATIASSMFLAGAAFADGSLKDTPVAEPEYVWDGLYVGVGVGVGKVDNNVDFKTWKKIQKQKCVYDVPDIAKVSLDSFDDGCKWQDYGNPYTTPVTKGSFSDDDWRVFGTLQLGYDRLVHDRILIGAFTDFDFFGDADSDFYKSFWSNYGSTTIDSHVSLDHIWNIGGRLGFLVTPRLALYADGGFSRGFLDGSLSISQGYGSPLTLNFPDHMDGYFVGGGAELKLRKNVSLKFEYRFTDLGSVGVSGSKSKTLQWCDDYRKIITTYGQADFDSEIQSVRAVLVLKFDEPEREVAAASLK